jgi:hypothetical protein
MQKGLMEEAKSSAALYQKKHNELHTIGTGWSSRLKKTLRP